MSSPSTRPPVSPIGSRGTDARVPIASISAAISASAGGTIWLPSPR